MARAPIMCRYVSFPLICIIYVSSFLAVTKLFLRHLGTYVLNCISCEASTAIIFHIFAKNTLNQLIN